MKQAPPLTVHSDDLEWLSRDVYPETRQGRTRWKTLISADHTSSQGLTMGMLEFPAGAIQQLHRHPQIETYYIVDGQGELEMDGEIHPMRAGSAAFIPADVDHRMRNTGDVTLKLVYTFAADRFADVEYTYLETL